MAKKKYNSRDITDLFILYFEGEKPFTPSEKRMLGIKLSQLRKNVKQYIQENNIETDLSENEIIIDAIEYSKMMDYKFRSIASLGYNVLGESIKYWKKRREILAVKKEMKQEQNQKDEKSNKEVIINSYNNVRKQHPKWMNTNQW